MFMTLVRRFFVCLSVVCYAVGCGSASNNMFEAIEEDDAAQDATNAMENNKPDKAIIILEKALSSDPENYKLISLLSAAYAQKYGVDLISLALELADSDSESKSQESSAATSEEQSPGNQSALTALWPILPEATEVTLAGIQHALDLLMSIPAAARTNADHFKLGILSTVNVSMQLKSLDIISR
jgi:thioredoxin-like negative regulator of GroEL